MELHDRLCDAVDVILYGPDSPKSNAEHADDLLDVLRSELEELSRLRNAWRAARRRASRAMGAWRYMRWHEDAQNKEMRAQDDFASWLWKQMSERRKERDRYRLAWLSARRRAADEANFGTEALALRDAEIRRLKAPSVD
jgi:hypothetical protein